MRITVSVLGGLSLETYLQGHYVQVFYFMNLRKATSYRPWVKIFY